MREVGTPKPHAPQRKWELRGANRGLQWYSCRKCAFDAIECWCHGFKKSISRKRIWLALWIKDHFTTQRQPRGVGGSVVIIGGLAFRYPAWPATDKTPPESGQDPFRCFEQLFLYFSWRVYATTSSSQLFWTVWWKPACSAREAPAYAWVLRC